MLEEIKIKNFALISELKVRFSPGLNILTGETGAGKSIIIDALGAILGDKMNTSYIRSGEEKAIIEGAFFLEANSTAEAILDGMGIEVEGRYLVVRREFNTEGRGRTFLNGVMLPAARLKEVAHLLVDIHGQNEHQAILRVSNHLKILDSFADLDQQRIQVQSLYTRYIEIKEQLKGLELNIQDREQRIDLLSHSIAEIESSRLIPGEEEELEAESNRLNGSEKLFEELNKAYALLSGQDSDAGSLSLLSLADQALSTAIETDARLHSLHVQLQEALFQLEDVSNGVREYIDQIEFSPERLEEIEERLDLISTLYKKYKVKNIPELLQALERYQKELAHINLGEEQIQQTREELSHIIKALSNKCILLSEARIAAAQQLEESMKGELNDLLMENSLFKVHIKRITDPESDIQTSEGPCKIMPSGIDYIEYYISAATGEKLRPLRLVASGGEMSRIMLALKKIVIDKVEPQSMVFDEIDAGVGGKVAERIGKKLKVLSQKAQVICITHLPQIAALADVQFKVSKKKEENDRMTTQLKRLTKRERLEEIARMMAGEKITDVTLEHAREMIRMAEDVKQSD